MVWSFLSTVSLALFWAFSPDALVFLGNGAGRGGLTFFFAFFAGALLSMWSVAIVHHPKLYDSDTSQSTRMIEAIGPKSTLTLALASRLSLVILLPTGMLVTAGFTFNETFLYWFPNFGFSFLLLGIVLSIHLLGDQYVRSSQLIFTTTAATTLFILAVIGTTSAPQQQILLTGSTPSATVTLFYITPILFLGYDQVFRGTAGNQRNHYWIAILAGFVLLSLWALASLFHVDPEKLSSSTVPYILSGLEIWGQPGRVLIGIIIISGTCGAVNGLFHLANSTLTELIEQLLPKHLQITGWKKRIFPVIFAVVIALCMATGLAGSEDLEVYIYCALLLWLAYMAIQIYSATIYLRLQSSAFGWSGYLLGALFLVYAVGLGAAHNHFGQILTFCFVVLVISAVFSTLFNQLLRKMLAPS